MQPLIYFTKGAFIQNLDLLSVALAVAGTFVLGFSVYFSNRQSITNKTFLAFSIVTAIWGTINYLAYQTVNPELVLWLFRFIMFFAVWQAFTFFQLFFVFPNTKQHFSAVYKRVLVPVVVATSLITLSPLILSGIIELTEVGAVSEAEVGPGIFFFGFIAVGLVLSGLVVLVNKMRFIKVKTEKQPQEFMLYGALIMFALIVVFNFLAPVVTSNRDFIPLGALFVFPFIAFTSYAVLKHKLFNIKVAGASLLVFVLSVIMFLEVIFAEEFFLVLYRSSILLLVLLFGILLIRNVIREVEQREQLEILSKELAAANAELKKLDQLKSDFLSFVSHQLRAPLTVIKGYISMIEEGTYGQIPQNIMEVLGKVFVSNEKLIRLVNDFLNLSRIEQGRMQFEFEKTSVATLIEEAVDALKDNAAKRGLTLVWQKPEAVPDITIDKSKVYEIIYNLIDNAIKYTENGSVSVELFKKPKSVVIAVKDTGIGLSSDDQKQLFQRFGRVEAGKKVNITGTGIGLYVAKYMVEAHKGRIWAESAGAGKGSTFFVELPLG